MGEVTVRRAGYRSLFWPIILIAVGVIWLLGNLGVISAANIIVLLRLWPLLLIVIGLDLLFGRQSPLMGALIGIGAVVVIVALMLLGPSIGLGAPNLEVVREEFEEPLEDATSASINLNLSVGDTTVQALNDSSDLFTAEVSHVGELVFEVAGQSEKTIHLSQQETSFGFMDGLGFLGAAFDEEQNLYWEIGLSPEVPLALNINSGVGENTLDLSQLAITRLDINSGVGTTNLRLPAPEERYNAAINGGAGNINVTITENAALDLNISGGVGNVVIDVPDGAAVRVDSSSGLGNVEIGADFRQVGGDDEIWETASYAESDRRITIEFDGGVGNLTVQ